MLKFADIDSELMLLRVERGKGGQYRNALLSADLLSLLRQWWTLGRQQGPCASRPGCRRRCCPAWRGRAAPGSPDVDAILKEVGREAVA